MFKNLKTFAVAVLASLACSGAHAEDWGLHDDFEIGFGTPTHGSFLDLYTFSLGDFLTLNSSVTVSNNNPPATLIQAGHYSLLSMGANGTVGGGDDLTLGGWAFDGSTGNTQHFVNLAAGNYYFAVSGNALGTSGGEYMITSTVSPVPEPETYAMLLTGLGLLGFQLRRRRKEASDRS